MKASFLFFSLVLLPLLGFSQTLYKLSPKSSLTVAGTSTMHDWTMTSQALEGKLLLEVANGQLLHLQQASLKIAAESLKSGKEAMDKNAYKALNTSKHPSLSFELLSIKSLEQLPGATRLLVLGKLTINGQTRTELFEATATTTAQGRLSLKGSKALKMSAYGVEPPSFMFGSVTTGDAITLSFDLLLSPGTTAVNQ